MTFGLPASLSAIKSFKLTPKKVPITVAFSISRETLPAAEYVFVQLYDESSKAFCGLGECAPFPSLTYDDMARAEVTAASLCREIVGQTPVQALVHLRLRRSEVITQSVTAFTGVETAVWDLFARQVNLPLAALWGAVFRDTLETDITLPIMPASSVVDFWRMYAEFGFRLIKIKVAGRVNEDVDLVRAMLDLAPAGTRITLDGNQGYRVESAKQLVQRLQALNIEPLFFEQPLPEDDWQGAEQLARSGGIRVCLDEAVRHAADVLRVVRDRCGHMINLKIMKSGIEESLRMLHIARAAGLEVMIGGMLESEVAMGTSLQIAAGTGGIDYADLDTPFFLKEPVTIDSPWHARNAQLRRGSGAGHGLQLC